MKKIISILILSLVIASCEEDFLDVSPSESLPPTEAFKDLTAISQTVLGMYSGLQEAEYYSYFMMAVPEVKGDDFQTRQTGKRTQGLYMFNETPEATNGGGDFWDQAYYVLNIANSIIENIDAVETETADDEILKNQYKGEALAMRALIHFDLARIFGKPYSVDNSALAAPLVITVQTVDDDPARATVSEMYNQVVSDFTQSLNLLPTGINDGRFNTWTVKALLSRVYLYMEKNAESLTIAKDVINNSPYSLVPNAEYVGSFRVDFNSERIFEIVNTEADNPGQRETIGYVVGPSFSTGGYGAVITTQVFEDLISSEPNDVRNLMFDEDDSGNAKGYFKKWPGKLGSSVVTNNIPVIRLSEVYLNAAEAAVKTNKPSEANMYLGNIMTRANPTIIVPASPNLNDVLTERRKELALEGHRFFDLMRNNLTVVREGGRHLLGVPTGLTNSDHRTIFPIPEKEMRKSNSLVQNPGY
ncbi:RagB/SusD family nutrient uptake outer membrane protein [Lutibacter sp. B1]|uniref:RagB/SusD family nutrient uptake outer membrane protein n=1 Tax=Lutibacter sp. B1 TaxID=2725996 RepID=UPI001456EC96|nr:RagB/SusD family nutrient uptake outer membrane protein [Lutibacter sp. B1]NLP58060.1 RagB/SusD family nutrient uptake outer membrane protein [Lutibacter sp. B1]